MMVPDQNSEQSYHLLGLTVHKPGSNFHLLEASVQVLKPKRVSKQGPSFSPDFGFYREVGCLT